MVGFSLTLPWWPKLHRKVFSDFRLQLLKNQDRRTKNMRGMALEMGFIGRLPPPPPPNGVFKANWDFVVFAKNQCMGVGVIIRDMDGQILVAKSATVFANFNPAAG
jgi:hypothetical protein